MFDILDVKGFKSYAGVVGTANTSFPLVVPVAAADNHTASYFAIREGNISLTPVCNVEIPNCFMTKQISFPFTFIETDADVPNTVGSVRVASDNSTFSIYPGLQLYICQYTQNTANSYSWARQFAIAAGILILTLELLKVVISLTATIFLIQFKQPSIVNFANNSPIWIFLLLRNFLGTEAILQIAMNLEETNSLQILSDTFLHSLPMLVLSIQSISYRFNEIKQPPPIITILSCVGSCAMLLFNFFRTCVSIKVTVPKQLERFKAELSQYFDKRPKQKRQQYLLIFALIDCAINLFPPIFMISLAVQGFNSVFVFIVPILVIFAKILICISMFWSQRFRKPLSSPLIFSFAMNSPIILLCIISSPLRQLITIIAADGFPIWTGWPTDFISIDLPILVILLMMGVFGHGNNQDVALLQRNLVLVIFATIYLVWRIISGLWYLRNSIITRDRDTNNKVHTRSTETFPIFYALKLNRESPTAWIFVYTLSKLLIWIVGLQIIITMVFMSQPPSPNPEAYVTVSPKILMVLGLVIYLCFDVIVSLALLISYYGPFSTRTIALYLNSPFLIIFYILLGPHFRAEIIAAAKDHVHALLLWKQRDIVLICSLLFIWPGFGFGYIPYGSDDRYSWWSWYGWGFDVETKKVENIVDSKWSFSGIFGAVYGLIFCVTSILRNTVPIDELDKQE
ncbi:unnamed protein product [Rhizophagus irregularis]|nr:hypothetical protein RirG_036580 [Rhizophagus irregularis DAOM 197198w]CAB4493896.1 unnamed protein product [Rhizophagus irregularis]CAB5181779.1 unnamed protein product [Rhizophagus irregularis]CAB5370117.1 unnamed protein product [Rhizophagus irregularis]